MSYIVKNFNYVSYPNYTSLNDTIIDRWWAALLNLFGAYIESAITTINYRSNWNKGMWCYLTACISYENTRDIVTIYINLVKNGKIPEYDRKNNPSKISFIEKEVQKIYGRNTNDVKVTLWELYYATLDGSLSTDEFLRPLTYKKTIAYKETPDLEGNNGGVEGLVNNLFSILKIVIWLIIIASVGYGAYVLYNFYNKKKE